MFNQYGAPDAWAASAGRHAPGGGRGLRGKTARQPGAKKPTARQLRDSAATAGNDPRLLLGCQCTASARALSQAVVSTPCDTCVSTTDLCDYLVPLVLGSGFMLSVLGHPVYDSPRRPTISPEAKRVVDTPAVVVSVFWSMRRLGVPTRGRSTISFQKR